MIILCEDGEEWVLPLWIRQCEAAILWQAFRWNWTIRLCLPPPKANQFVCLWTEFLSARAAQEACGSLQRDLVRKLCLSRASRIKGIKVMKTKASLTQTDRPWDFIITRHKISGAAYAV